MFVDARVARHGRHSVRLTTPADDVTVRMGQFPVKLTAGRQYRVSIWAKARTAGVLLKLSMGELVNEQVALTTGGRERSYTISPEKDIPRATLGIGKVMMITCTYDHRVIQGAESGMFLARVHALLQGEDGFYDKIFSDLKVPHRPVRLSPDRPVRHLQI